METTDMYNKISPQEEDPVPTSQAPPPVPAQRHGAWMNFCIGFLMVFSVFSIGREIKQQFHSNNQIATSRNSASWGRAIDSIVTPETVGAIGNDPRLRRTLMSMVDFTVDLSDQLAARYDSPQFQETRDALQEYTEMIKRSLGVLEDDDVEGDDLVKSNDETEPAKRQLPGLGDLLVVGKDNDGETAPERRQLPGLPSFGDIFGGGGGGATGNMSAGILSPLIQPLVDGLKNVGNQLVSNLNGPGMFLGIGVGAGAAQGLNLSTPEKTLEIAAKVAADNKMGATGLNPAIQNLGVGLTSTLLGSIDLNKAGGGIKQKLQPIALALATGIGNGTVAGLKLNPNAANLEPVNDSSIANVVGTFGFGLTKTVTSNIDINKLFNQASNSDATRRLMEILPAAASGLGNGLGEGATVGLGLQPDAAVILKQMPDGSIDFGGISETFAKALTTSFLRNGTADELLKKVNATGNDASRRLMDILPAAASGLGKGLGQGATVGLGLQPDVEVRMKQMADGSLDFGGITQTFAKGLTSSFLQNGTAGELLKKAGNAAKSSVNGGGGIPSTIDFNGQTIEVGKAAQGFARGFIQAAGDSIQTMGGVQSLFAGNATIPTGPPPDSKVDFNDTIGGAAIGFGSGIGGQGVVVVYGLIKNPHGTNMPATAGAPALPATSAPAARRDLELAARQDPPPIVSIDTKDGFNLSVVINAQTVSAAAQTGVNALSCQGIGGLGLIGLGLIRSNTISLDMVSGGSNNATKAIQQLIPSGTIKIANEGHFYAIDGGVLRDSLGGSITNAANAIEVNGFKLPGWIAFLIIHIIFAIVAYINILPLAIGLEHLRNLLLRVNAPQVLPNVQKWNNIMWLFVMGPSVVLVLIFGALITAKSAHFRTAHGIISLLTTFIGLGAVLLHLAVKARAPPQLPRPTRSPPPPPPALMSLPNIRLVVNQLFLVLSFASVITGFTDLSSVALCFTQVVPFDLTLVIGFGLSTVFVLGSSISGLDIALTVRDSMKRRKGGQAISAGAAESGGGVLQGKISAPKIAESNKEKGNFV